MSISGVQLSSQVNDIFSNYLKPRDKSVFCIFLKLAPSKTQIEVESVLHDRGDGEAVGPEGAADVPPGNVLSQEARVKSVVKAIPPNECRYIIFDFAYTEGEEGERNKILMVTWVPDTAKISDKMLYASSKPTVTSAIEPAAQLHFTEVSDITFEELRGRFSRREI